ncbi:hypothetical protein LCGC14_1189690 [marine sediment metagenome]|uniref:Uncharacterized protein n=1 Tax=marine sediment metagenome TaxID=412755 RepID=A0A0F9LPP8_9ZZZZ
MKNSYLDWILNTDARSLRDMIDKVDTPNKRETPSPRIICNDGASVSIQASETSYCTPRSDYAPWGAVEAGFPNVIPPDSWAEYAEQWHSENLFADVRGDLHMAWFSLRSRKFRMSMSVKHWIRSAWLRIQRLKPTDTVYGWLPVELVKEFIDVHGGENLEKCWEWKE